MYAGNLIDIFLTFYDGNQGQELVHSNFFFYFEHEGCQTNICLVNNWLAKITFEICGTCQSQRKYLTD